LRFVVDESVELVVATELRKDGHDAVHIVDIAPSISDPDVLALSFARDAILITQDKGFGKLIEVDRLPAVGVVLLRLNDLRAAEKPPALARAIAEFGAAFHGAITTVTSRAVRIRPIP
jgi:predicted nuclease of predicted toxin-antitoxin system